jgi:hypothetical protein
VSSVLLQQADAQIHPPGGEHVYYTLCSDGVTTSLANGWLAHILKDLLDLGGYSKMIAFS